MQKYIWQIQKLSKNMFYKFDIYLDFLSLFNIGISQFKILLDRNSLFFAGVWREQMSKIWSTFTLCRQVFANKTLKLIYLCFNGASLILIVS